MSGWAVALCGSALVIGLALKPTAPVAPASQPVTALPAAGALPSPAAPSPWPTAQPQPTALPAPTPTLAPPPATVTSQQPLRVGIQAGHWKANELPDELARLRGSTGGRSAGISETDITLAVASRVIELLGSLGVQADLLPATVPPGYAADAFVAIHADGTGDADVRGFKLATPWRASAASRHLLDTMREEYASASGIPAGGAPSIDMRGYYAFAGRHPYIIAPTTPAIILEMGFLTNAADRSALVERQEYLAIGVANGIIRYLNERDPADTAALIPPFYGVHRAIAADTPLRYSPADGAGVLRRVGPDTQLIPLQQAGEWMEVVVRNEWGVVGWVRASALRAGE